MRMWGLMLVLLLGFGMGFAQVPGGGVYKVKNGSDVSSVIPFAERYQFDKFQQGTVLLRNGRSSRALMNYNLVHGEVLFIDAKKDTLLFDNTDFISKIFVGDDLFYYTKGHGHVHAIQEFGKVKLGKKLFLVRMGNEKYASYQQYSATSAISSYSSFINQNGNFQALEGNEKVILKRRAVYFLIDQNERVMVASRPNLLKIYHVYRKELTAFLKQNDSNLETEADWTQVLEFAGTLH